jgi:hypothetical protein
LGLPADTLVVTDGPLGADDSPDWRGSCGSRRCCQDDNLVQLDDLVVVEAPVPGGGQVTFYGIVDQVRKRYEGTEFDTDAFRAAEGVLPVQISYAGKGSRPPGE